MTRDDVCAVIVTRGNVDIEPILRTLPTHWGWVVWDNSIENNLGVFGRYAGIERAVVAKLDDPADVRPGTLIYVQDDDCLLRPESFDALLGAWQPGHVVCNMPEPFRAHYSDSALVGFGALFERDLPERAFARFARSQRTDYARDPDGPRGAISALGAAWERCCDVVFTTLTPMIWVDVPYENLPYAYGADRMYRQAEHVGERARMLDLARQVRDRG